MTDLVGISIGLIFGGIIGYLIAITVAKKQRKWGKLDKKKEELINKLRNHKKELVDVLKKLEPMEIKCEKFTPFIDDYFKVWIGGLGELKRQSERTYKQTKQHLKIAYPYIHKLWNNSIKKIYGDNGLNDKLLGLRKYLSGKIRDNFDVEWVKLHSSIWYIMEWAKSSEKIKDSEDLDKFLDGIYIEIEKNKMYINSDIIKNPPINITFRKLDTTKVSKFLSGLIKKDEVFREKLKSFTLGYKELKETFENDFKNELHGLLQKVKGDEEKLKGECDECLSLLKNLANCKRI